MRKANLTLALLAASALALGACSGETPSSDASTGAASDVLVPSNQSVPDALDNADGLQTVAEALKSTGIADIFDGNGSYTLLAPDDDAFAALGDTGKELIASSDHAALAALIKDHMLPGYVTSEDLGNAIDASTDGQVTMTTLGGDDLTFTRQDDTIVVTAADGAQATLENDPVAGGSSIALPINAVLKKV